MVWRYVWQIARDIAGDDQTMEFKGQHADKLRIAHKDEGNSFQIDSDNGYTYTFCFCN